MDTIEGPWYDDIEGDEEDTEMATDFGAKASNKLKKDERYDAVVALMETFFERAEQDMYTPLDIQTQSILDETFASKSLGFREILLLVVIARLLNLDYKATVDFYECNPRPIFEQPIFVMLEKYGIPSRLSGPLNMAKSTEKLNNQWAAGRRRGKQRALAYKLVPLLENVDKMSREELENFAVNLHARFLKIKEERKLLTIEAKPEADPMILYQICQQLIEKAADVGNTPQKIVGFLLEVYHETFQTGVIVSGHEDRSSTTNTTAKKIGDITEEQPGGNVPYGKRNFLNIYEVSVKPFGEQRVREAYAAVRTYDTENSVTTQEIIVICREQDCHPDARITNAPGIYLGKLEHQDIVFLFVNIYPWIMAQLIRMPAKSRLAFYNKMNSYIQHRNTSPEVMAMWKILHEDLIKDIE